MEKNSKIISFLILLLLAGMSLSCRESYSPKVDSYINSILRERALKDSIMEFAHDSPFNFKSKVKFHPLNYFEVDTNFIFKSKFYPQSMEDTLYIYGTKGEKRKTIRVGYLILNYNNFKYHLNVYKNNSDSGMLYYSIWFTDRTTNEYTYGVGRYLDFELNNDPEFIYTIDFNKSYNPYCSYSPAYSCAIPTKEDHINFAVKAGEKKFHE